MVNQTPAVRPLSDHVLGPGALFMLNRLASDPVPPGHPPVLSAFVCLFSRLARTSPRFLAMARAAVRAGMFPSHVVQALTLEKLIDD